MKFKTSFTMLFIAIATLGLNSCGGTTLKSIKENPAKYSNKDITVKGSIIHLQKLPMVDILALYELHDDTEGIWVISFGADDYKQYQKHTVNGRLFYLIGDDKSTKQLTERLLEVFKIKKKDSKKNIKFVMDLIVKGVSKWLKNKNLTMVIIEN